MTRIWRIIADRISEYPLNPCDKLRALPRHPRAIQSLIGTRPER